MEHQCAHCGKSFKGRPYRRYCGSPCAAAPKRAGPRELQAWLDGAVIGHTGLSLKLKPWVRAWVLDRAGHSCSICGWNERHPDDGRPLVEVDHLDGDAMNSRPDNLRVLCPNHHAMTSTYRRRNALGRRRRQSQTVVLGDVTQ
jgi:hypothetical protein